jgi:hypothetical protein
MGKDKPQIVSQGNCTKSSNPTQTKYSITYYTALKFFLNTKYINDSIIIKSSLMSFMNVDINVLNKILSDRI